MPIASSFELTIGEDKTSPVTVKLQNNSYGADMVVEYPLRGTIYYEFKSVKNLPPGDFLDQFRKDLSRDNFSVDNLRWVFDGKKITRLDLEKLRRDIEKVLSEKSPTMLKKEKELLVKRILDEIFAVN